MRLSTSGSFDYGLARSEWLETALNNVSVVAVVEAVAALPLDAAKLLRHSLALQMMLWSTYGSDSDGVSPIWPISFS